MHELPEETRGTAENQITFNVYKNIGIHVGLYKNILICLFQRDNQNSKKYKQYNGQKKDTPNDLPNTAQKTKD